MRTVRTVCSFMALIGVVGFGCASPLPREEPLPVFPTKFAQDELRDVSNIVVVTDASGTMYGAKTFPQAKALSTSFLKALPDRGARANTQAYNVEYVAFGGDDRLTTGLAPFDRSKLVATSEQAKIMGSIDGLGGTTPVHAVIEEIGASLEGKRGKTAVVLFSDGIADDPPRAVLAGKTLVESRRRDPICFHTIQVGSDAAGSDFLRTLAATSPCGSARNAASIANDAAFQSYAKAIVVGAAPLPDVAAAPTVSGLCEGKIRLRGIEFGFDKYNITPAGAAVLDTAISTLEGCPDVKLQIDGFTDNIGTKEYNLGLSDRRAGAVRSYFEAKGVSEGRLSTQGRGMADPVASNDTREGRARNRRVELRPE